MYFDPITQQPIGAPVENWPIAKTHFPQTLIGQYCTLERLNIKKHAEGLYQAFSQDSTHKIWTYLLSSPFDTAESFTGWLQTKEPSTDPIFFCILNQNQQCLGIASFLRITPMAGTVEVGHLVFSSQLQRTTVATECMYLMADAAFQMGYRRYEWKCDSLNQASLNAAKRLGFVFEGVHRQALVYKGRNRDTAWFSILDKEWDNLKPAFQKWLDTSNFNADGRQKLPLQHFIALH